MKIADKKKLIGKKLTAATSKRVLNNDLRKEINLLDSYDEFDYIKLMKELELIEALYKLAKAKSINNYREKELKKQEENFKNLLIKNKMEKLPLLEIKKTMPVKTKSLELNEKSEKCKSEKMDIPSIANNSLLNEGSLTSVDQSLDLVSFAKESLSISFQMSSKANKQKGLLGYLKKLNDIAFDKRNDSLDEKNFIDILSKETKWELDNFIKKFLENKENQTKKKETFNKNYLPLYVNDKKIDNLYDKVESSKGLESQIDKENQNFLKVKENIMGFNEHDFVTDRKAKETILTNIVDGKNSDITCQCFRIGATSLSYVLKNKFNLKASHKRFLTKKAHVALGDIGEAFHITNDKNHNTLAAGTIAPHPLFKFLIAKNDFFVKSIETGELMIIEIKSTKKKLPSKFNLSNELYLQIMVTMECFFVKTALIKFYELEEITVKPKTKKKDVCPIIKYKINVIKEVVLNRNFNLFDEPLIDKFLNNYVNFLDEYFAFNGYTFDNVDRLFFLKQARNRVDRSMFRYERTISGKCLKSSSIMKLEIKPSNHAMCDVLYGFIFNKKSFCVNKYVNFKREEKRNESRPKALKKKLCKFNSIYKDKISKKAGHISRSKIILDDIVLSRRKFVYEKYVFKSSINRKVLTMSIVIFKYFTELLRKDVEKKHIIINNKRISYKSEYEHVVIKEKKENKTNLGKRDDADYCPIYEDGSQASEFYIKDLPINAPKRKSLRRSLIHTYNPAVIDKMKYLSIPPKLLRSFNKIIIKKSDYFSKEQSCSFKGLNEKSLNENI